MLGPRTLTTPAEKGTGKETRPLKEPRTWTQLAAQTQLHLQNTFFWEDPASVWEMPGSIRGPDPLASWCLTGLAQESHFSFVLKGGGALGNLLGSFLSAAALDLGIMF